MLAPGDFNLFPALTLLTEKMTKERKLYLDVLRILATYAVILLHVTSKYIGTSDYRVLIAWDSLVRSLTS